MEFSWESVLQKIHDQISKPSYETWFKSTSGELNDDTVTIYAANAFARDWIENHYEDMLFEIIKEMLAKPVEIIVVSTSNMEKVNRKNRTAKTDTNYDIINNKNQLLMKQQEKIDELERRIRALEQKVES
ncbi:DnaA N-terminal domain-containing protein [Lysinibacillus sp. BW-2-10]|uniref:DnaA N-terminal domain-containing protein n=1 Tax=Lysinibacillus sp. BW-2-10 TaxID=2590030 RepID=UPI00117DD4E8|nr:DnaA N-terminal domain-containing protein [Lysinibacillus sp. BW-2-10]TSI03191.1 hypothetical protein FJQ64_16930 [Lysinibacillus sp. BW-2-10]